MSTEEKHPPEKGEATAPATSWLHSDIGRTNVLLGFLVVLGLGFLFYALQAVLRPLAIALFLSYLGMPVMRLARKIRVPVSLATLLVIAVFAMVLGALGVVVIASASELTDELPRYQAMLEKKAKDLGLPEFIEKLARWEGGLPEEETDAPDPVPDPEVARPAPAAARQPLWRQLLRPSQVLNFAGQLLGSLTDAFLVLFFLVFILLDRGREAMDRRVIHAFSRPGTESARQALEQIHKEVERYIITKTGISMLTGAAVSIALSVLDLPFALLFGIVALVMNFIPNVGSILACIPPILLAFLYYESPWDALVLAVVLTTIQTIIGNLLEPWIMGRRLNLNPITVLLFLVIWGWMWGIWGMVLAVPIASSIRIVTERSQTFRAIGALMSEG
jgi:predicted PurR-regulated permease PerM